MNLLLVIACLLKVPHECTLLRQKYWFQKHKMTSKHSKRQNWGVYKAIHPWIEVFPPLNIHTHAMTKANGAKQEEEELDHWCLVFHKEIQIAVLSAVTCTQWGLCREQNRRQQGESHEHHISSLLSRTKHSHESSVTTSVHAVCTHINTDECSIWKTLVRAYSNPPLWCSLWFHLCGHNQGRWHIGCWWKAFCHPLSLVPDLNEKIWLSNNILVKVSFHTEAKTDSHVLYETKKEAFNMQVT